MKLLFTKSKLPFSKLICWLLEEPVSHVGIQYKDYVAHSYFDGIRVESLEKFTKNRQVVYSVNITNKKEIILFKLRDRYNQANYDYLAFLYIGWRAVLRKFFKVPFPTANKWNIKGALICVELATVLLNNKEEGILTPYALYKRITK